MIYRIPRADSNDAYDLKLIDKNGNSFVMHFAGNMDLYWVVDDHRKCMNFYVDKNDEFLYSVFEKLFEDIKKNDTGYKKSVEGNVFSFISEDYHEDDANMLQIEKKEGEFEIRFAKNFSPNLPLISKMCQICFCNSGSRVPNIERQFMLMFIDLSRYNDAVEIEKE